MKKNKLGMISEEEDFDIVKGLRKIEQKKKEIAEDLIMVRKLYDDYLISRNKKLRRISYGLLTAAAVIFILFFIGSSFTKINFQNTYKKWYQPLKQDEVIRAVPNNPDPLTLSIIYYSKGVYEDSYLILDSLSRRDSLNKRIIFYKSLIEIENQNFNSARIGLNKLLFYGSTFKAQAHWYLLLIAIYEENTKMIKENLFELKKMPGKPYLKKVRKLLRKFRFRKSK